MLRYFTVYGPASRSDMGFFRFARWIVEAEPLVSYGDGSRDRDFTCLDDIAVGTALALRPVGYRVVSLGSVRPVPVSRVIALLEKVLGARARVERRPPHPADAPATWADITRARRELGWSPAMPLAKGLARAVEGYRENRAWASRIHVGEVAAL